MQVVDRVADKSGGPGKIYSRIWECEEPKAVLQIAHGMAEHSARYGGLSTFLAGHGILTCANDHGGHGRSAGPGTFGHFADKDGWEHTISDMKLLMDDMAARHPGKPLFLMGHSMGSILARCYITRYHGLAGCVISGTVGANPLLGVATAIASLQKLVLGPRTQGKLLNKIQTGPYNKRIENPASKHAWLSRDEEVCRQYEADPECAFFLTAGGYYDMLIGTREVTGAQWAQKVPKDLPILQIAGDQDPVGDYGEGPRMVDQWLRGAGVDAGLKLYAGGRHEMLNEVNKLEVYDDILEFIVAHI